MKKSLQELDEELTWLEAMVMEEYTRLKIDSVDDVGDVRIPRTVAERLEHHLMRLWERLLKPDVEAPRLVCERHDRLRLRMIALEGLLARDVPFAYLERSLRRRTEIGDRPPTPARRSAPIAITPGRTRRRQTQPRGPGLFAWIEGLLGRTRGWRYPVTPTRARASPAAPHRRDTEALVPTVRLYREMQADRLHLMHPGQALPPLPMIGEDRLARFEARDLHERFWLRTPEPDPIARTPEELRRKLQAQAHRYTDSPAAA